VGGDIVLGDSLLVVVPFHLSKLDAQAILEGDIVSSDVVRVEQDTPGGAKLGVPVDDKMLEVIDGLIDVGIIEDQNATISFVICMDGTIRELDDMSACFVGSEERVAGVFWAFPIVFRTMDK